LGRVTKGMHREFTKKKTKKNTTPIMLLMIRLKKIFNLFIE
jgi:hypothetical protein